MLLGTTYQKQTVTSFYDWFSFFFLCLFHLLSCFEFCQLHPYLLPPSTYHFNKLTALGNTEIWLGNTEAAVFQWCYLFCSVITPCNNDPSLLFVMCSIFIYDQASFFCFTVLLLDLWSILFCAISATNEKKNKRNILCADSWHFLWCTMKGRRVWELLVCGLSAAVSFLSLAALKNANPLCFNAARHWLTPLFCRLFKGRNQIAAACLSQRKKVSLVNCSWDRIQLRVGFRFMLVSLSGTGSRWHTEQEQWRPESHPKVRRQEAEW